MDDLYTLELLLLESESRYDSSLLELAKNAPIEEREIIGAAVSSRVKERDKRREALIG